MRIAVIGTGISGLTAAHLLAPHHDVTVYEAADRLGGHAHTVTVEDPLGPQAVDTGFIVYNERNYTHFTDLLRELEVETRESVMGLSISDEGGGFELAGTRRGFLAQPANALRPRFWRAMNDQLRFNREVRPMAGREGSPTLGEFLSDSGYSAWFRERVIIPQVAAVWSSDPETALGMPVGFLAEFFDNHGQLQLMGRPRWRTVSGGSRRYVEAAAEAWQDRVLLSAPVQRVERLGIGVAVRAVGQPAEIYDEVVIATHSDQALAMLADPTPAERSVLGAIRYQANEAALHTDTSVMPRRRGAWASWNFHLRSDARQTTMTYWMNRLQGLRAERDYLVTLNRTDALDPESVLAVIDYDHPVIDHRTVAAQGRWGDVSGADRIHYCGAYWRWGFHEDGCWSAHRACRSLLAQPQVTIPSAEGIAELQEAA